MDDGEDGQYETSEESIERTLTPVTPGSSTTDTAEENEMDSVDNGEEDSQDSSTNSEETLTNGVSGSLDALNGTGTPPNSLNRDDDDDDDDDSHDSPDKEDTPRPRQKDHEEDETAAEPTTTVTASFPIPNGKPAAAGKKKLKRMGTPLHLPRRHPGPSYRYSHSPMIKKMLKGKADGVIAAVKRKKKVIRTKPKPKAKKVNEQLHQPEAVSPEEDEEEEEEEEEDANQHQGQVQANGNEREQPPLETDLQVQETQHRADHHASNVAVAPDLHTANANADNDSGASQMIYPATPVPHARPRLKVARPTFASNAYVDMSNVMPGSPSPVKTTAPVPAKKGKPKAKPKGRPKGVKNGTTSKSVTTRKRKLSSEQAEGVQADADADALVANGHAVIHQNGVDGAADSDEEEIETATTNGPPPVPPPPVQSPQEIPPKKRRLRARPVKQAPVLSPVHQRAPRAIRQLRSNTNNPNPPATVETETLETVFEIEAPERIEANEAAEPVVPRSPAPEPKRKRQRNKSQRAPSAKSSTSPKDSPKPPTRKAKTHDSLRSRTPTPVAPEIFIPPKLSKDIATSPGLVAFALPGSQPGPSRNAFTTTASAGPLVFSSWENLLHAGCNFQFAPAVDYFKHAPMLDVWNQWGQITGSLFEVPNPFIATTNRARPAYWLARVIHFAGYKAFIQLESFGTEPEYIACMSYFSDVPKPLGFAAENNIALLPPTDLSNKMPNFLEKAAEVARLTPTSILPTHSAAIKTILEKCQKYELTQKVEVIDLTAPDRMTLAFVIGVVGDRIHVKYVRDSRYNDPAENERHSKMLWFNVNSEQVRPLGWSHAVGTEFDGQKPVGTLSPSHFSASALSPEPEVTMVKGQVLEVRHPLRLGTICAAIVHQVLKHGFFVADIRTTEEESRYPTRAIFHVTSPYVFPCGFTQHYIANKNGNSGSGLIPPYGEPKDLFAWDSYMSRLNLTAAPLHLLPKRSAHKFKAGMKLEAVLYLKPAILTPATILNTAGHLLQIQYDDHALGRDTLWIDAESPDIYPIGYSELVGQAFEGNIAPPPLSAVMNMEHEKKQARFGQRQLN